MNDTDQSDWRAGDIAVCIDVTEAPELTLNQRYPVMAISYWGGLIVDSNEDGYASCRFKRATQ